MKIFIFVWKWNLKWEIVRNKSGIGPFRMPVLPESIEKKGYKDFINDTNQFSIDTDNNSYQFIGFTKAHRFVVQVKSEENSNEISEYKLKEIKPYTDDDIIYTCDKALENGKVLLLLHGNPPDNFNIDCDLVKNYSNNLNVKVDIFSSGRVDQYPIYKIIDQAVSYFRDIEITFEN